jgi:molybdate transport system substrate-binding protein
MRLWLAILPLALAGCARTIPSTLTVSVAASLHPAIDEVAQRYGGNKVVLNFGGSGSLANQIVNGAPADVFLAAGPKPMDDLAARGLLLHDTRCDLLRNDLVLVTTGTVQCFDSLTDPAVKHIAIGEPDSVPAGDYARQVLTALHLWDRLQPKLVFAADVRQVLAQVASGNADAGIVYATDARTEPKVRVACAAPPNTHAPVVYPVAVLANTHHPDAARSFGRFLAGPEARAIFERHGFTVVP